MGRVYECRADVLVGGAVLCAGKDLRGVSQEVCGEDGKVEGRITFFILERFQ
jgi:hypothetical protein